MQFLPADAWALQQFGAAALGDQRLTRRLVGYAAAAAANPQQSIPGQCGTWKQTKGAYRLFDNDATTYAKVIQPHLSLTHSAAAAAAVVLHLSDTTTLSLNHPHTQGLGPTGSRGRGRGILLHSTLAVDVSGGIEASPRVLGLSHQHLWTRTAAGKLKPESSKWPQAINAIGPAPARVRYVYVSDAESDCWSTLAALEDQSLGHVIRVCQDRVVSAAADVEGEAEPEAEAEAMPEADADADAQVDLEADSAGQPALQTKLFDLQTKLFELVRSRPALGGKWLWARARGNEEARLVKLLVSATAVLIHPPRNWSDKPYRKHTPRPRRRLKRWAVRVWEANPPADREPIEWVLLSDQPVLDLQAALQVAFWYSCRWLIEEYHKCLKSGCRIETRQLEHIDRLEPLVGVLSVVAVRLLQLKHQARVNPEMPAEQIVPKAYVQTLGAWLKMPAGMTATMTARQFWRATAQLGGFLARKGDGDPGWQTLWHGWWKLQLLTEGAALARGRG
jgi:hypothetical protein